MIKTQSLFRTATNAAIITVSLIRYNLIIVFSHKFRYFFGAAIGVFLAINALMLYNIDAAPDEGMVFWMLLIPGMLVVFYPSAFGIQNDVDTGMIEILFGIPNYRYTVWLVRLLLIIGVVTAMTAGLGVAVSYLVSPIPVIAMTFHLVLLIGFFGGVAFMASTIIKSGNGAAVVTVIVGIVCWVMRDFFESHRTWDIFLNPFSPPTNMSPVIWYDIVFHNRIYLAAAILITVLAGLLNLQNRERFLP